MRRGLLFVLCVPTNVLGLVLAFLMTTGSRPIWQRHANVLLVRPAAGSWLARHWPYSTTFGHVILFHPDHDDAVLEHELVHVLQVEACCLGFWLLTLVGGSLSLVWLSPFAWLSLYGAACVAAWLSGAEAYRGNVFERHARAEILARSDARMSPVSRPYSLD